MVAAYPAQSQGFNLFGRGGINQTNEMVSAMATGPYYPYPCPYPYLCHCLKYLHPFRTQKVDKTERAFGMLTSPYYLYTLKSLFEVDDKKKNDNNDDFAKSKLDDYVGDKYDNDDDILRMKTRR